MSIQVEHFASDTGQFSIYAAPGGILGSLTITGGVGEVFNPWGGFGHGATLCLQNQFTAVTSASCLVVGNVPDNPFVASSGTGGTNYLNYTVGLLKDGNNFICFETGVQSNNHANINFDILMFIAGTQYNLSASTNTQVSPDKIAFGMQGNVITGWFSIGGVWQSVPAVTVNVGSIHDFTAAGALTGWNAFMGCFNDLPIPSPGYIRYSLLSITQPFTDPTNTVTVPDVSGDTLSVATTAIQNAGLIVGTVSSLPSPTVPAGDVLSQSPLGGATANFGSTVNLILSSGSSLIKVYGKFAPALVFKPTLIADAKGLKPRIYMPKENITVKG